PLVLVQLFLNRLAEDAISKVVVMAKGFLKALAHLPRDHRGCDQLRMRMFEASTGICAMVFENREMSDTAVQAKFGKARFVDAENIQHLGFRHKPHQLGVARRLNNHIVYAEAVDGAPGTVNHSLRLDISLQRSKLVGD